DGIPIYRTSIAGSRDEYGTSIAVDSQHNAWVVGATYSPELMRIVEGTGPIHAHMFFAKYGPTGTRLQLGFEGADGDTIANGVAVDPTDQPWITGKTCGSGFPTTDHSDRSRLCKVFVMQLDKFGERLMSMVIGGSD